MPLRDIMGKLGRPFLHGALLTAVVGLLFAATKLGAGLDALSFDVSTVLNTSSGFPELVLIQMDESSHDHLRQSVGKPWSRNLHAELVNHLRRDGARQVIFDVEFFEEVGDPSSTAALAAAMREHGNVFIGARLEFNRKPGFVSVTEVRWPDRALQVPGVTTAISWNLNPDNIVRLHPIGRDPDLALPWVAAAAVAPELAGRGARHDDERWVRFYGPAGTLPYVSYWRATDEGAGYYRGKTVFIGGRTATGFAMQEVDQFRTPISRWEGSRMSGVELCATAWLNLVRGDWINRVPAEVEMLLLAGFGVLLGGVSAVSRLRNAAFVNLLALGLVFGGAVWLFRAQHLSVNWAVAALVQVPVAFAWRGWTGYRESRREKEWLEAPLGDLFSDSALVPENTKSSSQIGSPSTAGAFEIPEYEMLSCVGRGAYGEVWLARDVLGGYRAVKIVRRVSFDDDGPYEREFRGLQAFAPVSLRHSGLVQVLHVGLNRAGGFFYYVMEVGDDVSVGQAIVPETYVPRNLARDLRLHGLLDAERTARLGVELGTAVEFLHQGGLIHRDIKPANVIFVAERPKLADIGLVTHLAGSRERVSQVGTEGYLPPEGAGTAGADVFALGRVLQEALGTAGDDAAVIALRRIIENATAHDCSVRISSARGLVDELLAWQSKHSPRSS